ncbi:MAG: hypothetical protein LBU82_04895 [Treponema sp.]|nr:hypothetical protein [Treponema sp.]
MVWRVWYEKGTPLDEILYRWTYPDLLKANAVLDMYQAYKIADDAYMEEKLKKD